MKRKIEIGDIYEGIDSAEYFVVSDYISDRGLFLCIVYCKCHGWRQNRFVYSQNMSNGEYNLLDKYLGKLKPRYKRIFSKQIRE